MRTNSPGRERALDVLRESLHLAVLEDNQPVLPKFQSKFSKTRSEKIVDLLLGNIRELGKARLILTNLVQKLRQLVHRVRRHVSVLRDRQLGACASSTF